MLEAIGLSFNVVYRRLTQWREVNKIFLIHLPHHDPYMRATGIFSQVAALHASWYSVVNVRSLSLGPEVESEAARTQSLACYKKKRLVDVSYIIKREDTSPNRFLPVFGISTPALVTVAGLSLDL